MAIMFSPEDLRSLFDFTARSYGCSVMYSTEDDRFKTCSDITIGFSRASPVTAPEKRQEKYLTISQDMYGNVSLQVTDRPPLADAARGQADRLRGDLAAMPESRGLGANPPPFREEDLAGLPGQLSERGCDPWAANVILRLLANADAARGRRRRRRD